MNFFFSRPQSQNKRKLELVNQSDVKWYEAVNTFLMVEMTVKR